MNQEVLIKAYELQNKQNYEESVKSLEKIYKNFHILGGMTDQIPYSPFIIRENREILSQAHIDKLHDRFSHKIGNNFESNKNFSRVNGKKKQLKTKWSKEEQFLFMEGLELYGAKSKFHY